MLYLVTGANGAGKTLNTLKWVRERQIKEGRPVCHNGRFEPVEGGELSTWRKIDIKDWQSEPDGTIFLVDECHNDFPLRAPSSSPPEHVRMLAEHRRRGFDFYLVTQHPQNIDSFVRRLIGSPGWHRHLKRAFGGELVSVQEYPAVNAQCEKQGAGKGGNVTMAPFPRDVFTWYRSASLHTGKKRIPKAVWLLLICALLVPLLFALAFKSAGKTSLEKTHPAASGALQVSATPSQSAAPVQTVEAYLSQRTPRLKDFPHTAPVYDEVTKPSTAPYPAACVSFKGSCLCYTQQGTKMQVSGAVCLQIVKDGFFVDWDLEKTARKADKDQPHALGRGERAGEFKRVVVQERPFPEPAVDPGQITQADIKHQLKHHALGLRNPAMATIAVGQQIPPALENNRGPRSGE